MALKYLGFKDLRQRFAIHVNFLAPQKMPGLKQPTLLSLTWCFQNTVSDRFIWGSRILTDILLNIKCCADSTLRSRIFIEPSDAALEVSEERNGMFLLVF